MNFTCYFICFGLCFCSTVVSARKGYQVYWNIPVQVCNYLGSNLTNVIKKFGFTHNTNEDFCGDKIATIYNPGLFPSVINCSSKSITIKDCNVRNGGLPQLGNLTLHLQAFEEQLNRLVPDVDSKGIIVIDMEDWRPIFRSNDFGYFEKYRILSRNLILDKYPFLNNETAVELKATAEFESAAKMFMLSTIELAHKMRPKSQIGYYIFPFCFNYYDSNPKSCAPIAKEWNDKLSWLYSKQTATFPSLYLSHSNVSEEIRAYVMEARTVEGIRVSNLNNEPVPVYPYVNYRYKDNEQLYSDNDLHSTFGVPKKAGASGVVLWGSYHNVKTKEQCDNFTRYLNNHLGPIARMYIDKAYISSISQNLLIFSLLTFIIV